MKVLIAGGSGLIGAALTRRFLSDHHQVIVVSRDPGRLPRLAEGVSAVSWEIGQLSAALEGADAVVNLAGSSLAGSKPWQMRWTARRKAEIINSRLDAGKSLTRAIAQAERKPDLLIQASAIGYYGGKGLDPVDESSAPGEDYLARVCLAWEPSTQDVEALGLRRAVIRLGMVLSKDSSLLSLLKLPFLLYAGGKIGSGKQVFSWIHIDDVAGALSHLLKSPSARGVYNLTSPHPVPNTQFAEEIGRQLGKPAWFTLPAFALRLALGEAAALALDGRQVYPQRLLESGYNFRYETLESALADLLN